MSAKWPHALALILPALLGGCSFYQTANVQELHDIDKPFDLTRNTTYIKSDSRYHYFRNERTRWDSERDASNLFTDTAHFHSKIVHLKVPADELTLSKDVIKEAQKGDWKDGVSVAVEKDPDSQRWVALTYDEYRWELRYFKIRQLDKPPVGVPKQDNSGANH
ncbi:MAG TPA: hypothetical protein VG733_13910 [Chthoniobacteraceae bacterium]|nr:hypothetical protein [Chthoniobacteraceae bacterium]